MPSPPSDASTAGRGEFLVALGQRLRGLRARAGMTRKTLAQGARVSERHLANLESGSGNASILVLVQIADALGCPLAELLGDVTTRSPEWLMLREMLDGEDEETVRKARIAVSRLLDAGTASDAGPDAAGGRIALIGLRGAGKSTLGRRLADALAVPFIELGEEIEGLAGCSTSEIQALYGPEAYRRYERHALERVVNAHAEAVLAIPGGLVSDPGTFNLLTTRCTTVWVRATPREHMSRVVAQGDHRPMAGNAQAMDDLKAILTERTPFYAKADLALDTSERSLETSFDALLTLVRSRARSPNMH